MHTLILDTLHTPSTFLLFDFQGLLITFQPKQSYEYIAKKLNKTLNIQDATPLLQTLGEFKDKRLIFDDIQLLLVYHDVKTVLLWIEELKKEHDTVICCHKDIDNPDVQYLIQFLSMDAQVYTVEPLLSGWTDDVDGQLTIADGYKKKTMLYKMQESSVRYFTKQNTQ